MRNSYSKKHGPVNEINMTPFIDIMLVLLIIFMITAPLMTVGVEVDLPETQAGTMTENVEPLVVSIDKAGKIFIMEIPTEVKALVPRLQAITKNNMIRFRNIRDIEISVFWKPLICTFPTSLQQR